MKMFLTDFRKYIFYCVTIIQCVFALVWTVLRKPLVFEAAVGIVSIVSVCAVLFFVFNRKAARAELILFLVYIISVPAVLDTAVSKGHIAGLPDAPKASFEELCVQRFVWPGFYEMTDFSEYDFVSAGYAASLSMSPKRLYTDYFPLMRDNLSAEELSAEYKARVSYALSGHKKSIAKGMIKDTVSYVFAPVTAALNSFGYVGYPSLFADNYESFAAGGKTFGKIYMRFSSVAFLLLCLLGSIDISAGKALSIRKTFVTLVFLAIYVLYVIFFPVRGFDYRNAVPIFVLYALLLIKPVWSVNEHN